MTWLIAMALKNVGAHVFFYKLTAVFLSGQRKDKSLNAGGAEFPGSPLAICGPICGDVASEGRRGNWDG